MTTSTAGPTGPPEVTGLASAQAYARAMTEAYTGAAAAAETFAAGLGGHGVDGPAVDAVGRAQELTTAAAGAWGQASGALDGQTVVKEAYMGAPEAGDKQFVTDGDGGSVATPAVAHDSGASTPAGAGSPDGGGETPTGGTTVDAFRCPDCGHVVKSSPNDDTAPTRCPRCHTTGSTFEPTKVFYPTRPSDDAVGRDTRDVEAAIRAAYTQLSTGPGHGLSLADLREALPQYDRETVDAALTKLSGHSDVHVSPDRDQHQTDDRTQRAALAQGSGYQHTLRIYPDNSIHDTLSRIRMAERVQAESVLARVSDSQAAWLAEQMGVDTNGSPAELRQRIVERSDRNRAQWLADGEQDRHDGTLLYRADNEPDWVATWTEQDRQAAREAAQRLLAHPERLENWNGIKERAARWL